MRKNTSSPADSSLTIHIHIHPTINIFTHYLKLPSIIMQFSIITILSLVAVAFAAPISIPSRVDGTFLSAFPFSRFLLEIPAIES